MEELILIKPTLDWEQKILSLKEEFFEEHMFGNAGLMDTKNIPDWIDYLTLLEKTKPISEGWTATAFLSVRQSDQKIVGICSIRHNIDSEELMNISGHIGYSIAPSERRKGYAKIQLRLALSEARKMGMDRVLVTCTDWNTASEMTILANGGVYEDSRYDPVNKESLKRFWISLEKKRV